MTDDKITALLAESFADHRIVFWHDTELSFEPHLDAMLPDGVMLIRTDQEPHFEVKHRLECADTSGQYLLYSTEAEPDHAEDWLLDIRLYSKTFRADIAAAQLDSLGLTNAALHGHLVERSTFLRSKARLAALERLVQPGDQETDLDLKMLAVCCEIDHPDIDSVVMGVGAGYAEPLDLDGSNATWEQIVKLGLASAFWEACVSRYGYVHDEPTIADLLIHLFVTDWAATSGPGDVSGLPKGIAHLALPRRALWTHVAVCCSHWRSHAVQQAQYAVISDAVAKRLDLAAQMDSDGWDQWVRVQSFALVEQLVIRQLRDALVAGWSRESLTVVTQTVDQRRTGYWAGREPYQSVYAALTAAHAFLDLRRTYDAGFEASDLAGLAEAYTADIHRFDRYYRQFIHATHAVERAGADILKSLRDVIESVYTDWYLVHLAGAWDEHLAASEWLNDGRVGHMPLQEQFYQQQVAPIISQSSRTRVVVVISDALRYEAAVDVTSAINQESAVTADIQPMLGVLPSYTKLGMSALLPHRELAYNQESGAVLVDGKTAEGIEGRNRVLQSVQGMAMSADELIQMRSNDAREAVKDARVVYVYHDHIDAIGDKRPTEGNTCAAVEKTIGDLAQLVRFIVKNLNTSNVLVTADHGFLYQDSGMDAGDKAPQMTPPPSAVVKHKRFILGPGLGERSDVWGGSTAATAGMPDDQAFDFWLPKGANRFNLVGGARFTHGGAMPQEALVPLVKVKAKRGDAADTAQVRTVGVSLLTQVNRIVNTHQRFELLQSDPVSDKVRPRKITIAIRDADANDQTISDTQTVALDSTSENVNNLKREIHLVIGAGVAGKRPHCAIVLCDADTGIEIARHPVIVDISFAAEF